MVPPCAE